MEPDYQRSIGLQQGLVDDDDDDDIVAERFATFCIDKCICFMQKLLEFNDATQKLFLLIEVDGVHFIVHLFTSIKMAIDLPSPFIAILCIFLD